MMKRLMVLFALLVVAGCSHEGDLKSPSIPGTLQGVEGTVSFWEGDFMPVMPDGAIMPVSRTIAVFEAAGFDDVVLAQDGGFFSEVHTRLVGLTQSDHDGRYELTVPPGTYSVFVVENGLYYASGGTDEAIQPVTVVRDAFSTLNIDITYQATF